jgi:predicted outer membrane lipoprotein
MYTYQLILLGVILLALAFLVITAVKEDDK